VYRLLSSGKHFWTPSLILATIPAGCRTSFSARSGLGSKHGSTRDWTALSDLGRVLGLVDIKPRERLYQASTKGKVDKMKKLNILGIVLVAIFAMSMVVVATATAVEFLLALWLVGGVNVAANLAVDSEGELELEDTKTPLGKVKVLCSGILDGTVGPESKDEITKLLTLGTLHTEIPTTVLTEPGLACTDQSGGLCGEPLVWAELLPWDTEVELMIDSPETFFVDLILNGGYYLICMSSGIEDLCTALEVAVKLTNEAGGIVDNEFSDAFQELAGLKLGSCSLGGLESAVTTGLASLLLASGESLSVSSE
jgi:hypothetical protein